MQTAMGPSEAEGCLGPVGVLAGGLLNSVAPSSMLPDPPPCLLHDGTPPDRATLRADFSGGFY